MEFAVDAAALRGEPRVQERLEARVEVLLAGEQLLRELPGPALEARGAQLAQHLAGEIALALIHRALIERAV